MPRMHNPPHPGSIVGEDILPALGLSVTAGARALGVSRYTLNAVINGQRPVPAEMAIRLAKVFGGSAEIWVRMQSAHDLWQAEQHTDLSNLKSLWPIKQRKLSR